MWYDSEASYPEPKEKLGRWLGPAVDIGPAMTAKILKANGQVLYRSTYRALTETEIEDKAHMKLREEYDESIRVRIGRPSSSSELNELDPEAVTPEYEFYHDDLEGSQEHAPDIEDVTPEDLDVYVGAEVNLPIGGEVQSGKVRRRSRDDAGDVTGKANANPISTPEHIRLNSRMAKWQSILQTLSLRTCIHSVILRGISKC
jgi:hypothetical protein